jgi:hypothetical protein
MIRRPLQFVCDHAGCSEFFSAPDKSVLDAWSEAEQFGWRMIMDYDPISFRHHYCPSHAKVALLIHKKRRTCT